MATAATQPVLELVLFSSFFVVAKKKRRIVEQELHKRISRLHLNVNVNANVNVGVSGSRNPFPAILHKPVITFSNLTTLVDRLAL